MDYLINRFGRAITIEFDLVDWKYFFEELSATLLIDADSHSRIVVFTSEWARTQQVGLLNQIMARRAGLVTLLDRFQLATGLGFSEPRMLIHKNGNGLDFRRANLGTT